MGRLNGLGAWWFPEFFRVWLTKESAKFFREAAWINHDIGYSRGSPSREICDRKFLQAMLRDASLSPAPVQTALVALLLWMCVRVGGALSYNNKGKEP